MELREFVTETLLQIIGGVQDAQKNKSNNLSAINPKTQFQKTIEVKFEVSLTTTDESTSGIKGGIFVSIAKIGGEKADAQSSSAVNQIKFSIPVSLPTDTQFVM